MISNQPEETPSTVPSSVGSQDLAGSLVRISELDHRFSDQHSDPDRILEINEVIDQVLQELAQTSLPVRTESKIPILREVLNFIAQEQDRKLEAIIVQATEAHSNLLKHGDIQADHLSLESHRAPFLMALHDGLIHRANCCMKLGQKENARLCVDALKHLLQLDGASWALYCSVTQELPYIR